MSISDPMSPLFKKLHFKGEPRIVVLDPPASFEGELERLAGSEVLREAQPNAPVSFAMAFFLTRDQLDRASQLLAASTVGDATLWIAYPKGTSKRYRCELNRDSGWQALGSAGFEAVRQVAIDEDWTALRFRRTEFIRSMTRHSQRAVSTEGKERTSRR